MGLNALSKRCHWSGKRVGVRAELVFDIFV
jgi:hypothetical protein